MHRPKICVRSLIFMLFALRPEWITWLQSCINLLFIILMSLAASITSVGTFGGFKKLLYTV